MWGHSLDETHDAGLRSFVAGADAEGAAFPVQNLPLGVMRRPGEGWRGAVAIGEQVFDLAAWLDSGLVPEAVAPLVADAAGPRLNPLLERPCEAWQALRLALSRALRAGAAEAGQAERLLLPMAAVEVGLAVEIGDYTDFYASYHHASRCGRILRGRGEVAANFLHMPIGYHGRASTVVPSGVAVRRPRGFWLPEGAAAPVFAPTERLDFELELAAVLGTGTAMGATLPMAEAHRQIFGLVLMNDWSARDIQPHEVTPLGPFLSKSWATSVSGWIVTMGALAPFRAPLEPRPEGAPPPPSHLAEPRPQAAGLALELVAELQTAAGRAAGAPPQRVTRSDARHLYWSLAQMVAHHASNGCRLRAGDLIGSGTVSGPEEESAACLLERTEAGRRPLQLGAGSRGFLQDGDEVILTATARASGARSIGLGPVQGRVLPADPG